MTKCITLTRKGFRCCKCREVFGTVQIAKGVDPKGRQLICADCFLKPARQALAVLDGKEPDNAGK